MRDVHKILIVPLPHADLLLPERIFAHNNGSHPLRDQKVQNGLACSVQILVHLTVPLGGESLHLPGHTILVPL